MLERTLRVILFTLCVLLGCGYATIAELNKSAQVVIAPIAAEGDFGPFTPNTLTSGWQEAIDYCVANNLDLYIKGGFADSRDTAIGYSVSTTVRIPACKNFNIESGGFYTMGCAGPLFEIDSGYNCSYEFGLVGCEGAQYQPSILIKPTNPIPGGLGVKFSNSKIRIESTNSMRFDSLNGPIEYNEFYDISTIGSGYPVTITDGGYGFHDNKLWIFHLHTAYPNTTLMYVGTSSSRNIYYLSGMGADPGGTNVTGIDVSGSNDVYEVLDKDSCADGKHVVLEPSASGNVFNLLPTNAAAFDITKSVTDNSANHTNRVRWTAVHPDISSFTPPTGTYVYTQKIYPATARVVGGTVSQVKMRRGANAINYGGAWRNDIEMSPGDQLEVTSSVAPTIYITPRMR